MSTKTHCDFCDAAIAPGADQFIFRVGEPWANLEYIMCGACIAWDPKLTDVVSVLKEFLVEHRKTKPEASR